MYLLAQINSIFGLTTPLAILRIPNPSLNASFIIWQWQGANDRSQNIAAAKGIASMMQTGLEFKSSKCHNRFSLTTRGQPHSAKLRPTSF